MTTLKWPTRDPRTKPTDMLPKGLTHEITIAHHEYFGNRECFHKSCSLTWLSRPQDGAILLSVFGRKILNIYKLQASHLLFCSVLISILPRSLLPTPGPGKVYINPVQRSSHCKFHPCTEPDL